MDSRDSHLSRIVDELIALDPSLASERGRLTEAAATLAEARPAVEPDPEFVARLRGSLMRELAARRAAAPSRKNFRWGLVGSIFGGAVAAGFFFSIVSPIIVPQRTSPVGTVTMDAPADGTAATLSVPTESGVKLRMMEPSGNAAMGTFENAVPPAPATAREKSNAVDTGLPKSERSVANPPATAPITTHSAAIAPKTSSVPAPASETGNARIAPSSDESAGTAAIMAQEYAPALDFSAPPSADIRDASGQTGGGMLGMSMPSTAQTPAASSPLAIDTGSGTFEQALAAMLPAIPAERPMYAFSGALAARILSGVTLPPGLTPLAPMDPGVPRYAVSERREPYGLEYFFDYLPNRSGVRLSEARPLVAFWPSDPKCEDAECLEASFSGAAIPSDEIVLDAADRAFFGFPGVDATRFGSGKIARSDVSSEGTGTVLVRYPFVFDGYPVVTQWVERVEDRTADVRYALRYGHVSRFRLPRSTGYVATRSVPLETSVPALSTAVERSVLIAAGRIDEGRGGHIRLVSARLVYRAYVPDEYQFAYGDMSDREDEVLVPALEIAAVLSADPARSRPDVLSFGTTVPLPRGMDTIEGDAYVSRDFLDRAMR